MKQKILLTRAFAIGALAAQLTSCQKILDHWPGHHDDGENNVRNYRIKSIQTPASYDDSLTLKTAVFYYSSDNLLDSVISPTDATGLSRRLYFKYAQHNRLSEYEIFFADANDSFNEFHIIHKYATGNNDLILTDSCIYGGYMSGGSDYSSLEYDGYKRVVRDFHTPGIEGRLLPTDTVTFAYDLLGNRGLVDKVTFNNGGGNTNSTIYDSKVAYRSTNPIFQLIDRDWSRNNSNFATGYNSVGLPTGFSAGSTEAFLELGEPRVIEWEIVP